jgi:hypothetical protein
MQFADVLFAHACSVLQIVTVNMENASYSFFVVNHDQPSGLPSLSGYRNCSVRAAAVELNPGQVSDEFLSFERIGLFPCNGSKRAPRDRRHLNTPCSRCSGRR